MNVYDFDKTIYTGDSSIDFFVYCLKRNFFIIFFLPQFLLYFFLYILRIINKKKLKESFFYFLRLMKNHDFLVNSFWKTYESKMNVWYLEKRKDTDIIVSASPDFLLRPLTEKLNVTLIASVVNIKTGKFETENCYGYEKLNRLKDKDILSIDEFYSDSVSDLPLAQIAEKAYLVKKNVIKEWRK